VREYPQAEGDPFIRPRPTNEALFKRYQALAEAEVKVLFVGRLAQYRYYNMDQAIAAALALTKKQFGVLTQSRDPPAKWPAARNRKALGRPTEQRHARPRRDELRDFHYLAG
jgi:hypothetical protein